MHRTEEADAEEADAEEAASHQTTRAPTDTCHQCGRETHHTVQIELRAESDKEENAEFSREPYRVATCLNCGTKQTQRMNNA